MFSQCVVILEGFWTVATLFSSCFDFRSTIAETVMTVENLLVQEVFPTIQALSSQIVLLDTICQSIDFFISGVNIFDVAFQVIISPESSVTEFAVDSFYFFQQFDIVLG